MLFRGVVNQNVECLELRHCLLDRLSTKLLVADIARDENALPTMLLDQTLCFLRVFMFIEVHDRDITPSVAKAIATARPIPLSPPVMSATLFCSFPLPGCFSSSALGRGFILCSRPGCRF